MGQKYYSDELKRLRVTYSLLTKSSIVHFIWKNVKNWPVEYVSENVKTIFGYSDKEFMSGNILYGDIIHQEDLSRVTNEVKQLSDQNFNSFEHEPYRIIDKNGNIKWLKDITLIIRDDNNLITQFEGIIIDITEQKKAEEALKISENNYKKLVNNSPDLIYRYSTKRGTIFCTERIYDILGYNTHEVLDEDPFILYNSIHPEDKQLVENAIREKVTYNNFNYEYRIQSKNGKWIWFHDTQTDKIFDKDDIIIEGHASDITTEKTLAENLKASEMRWQFSVDGSELGLWDWDIITGEVFFSKQWKKMLGFEDNEITASLDE